MARTLNPNPPQGPQNAPSAVAEEAISRAQQDQGSLPAPRDQDQPESRSGIVELTKTVPYATPHMGAQMEHDWGTAAEAVMGGMFGGPIGRAMRARLVGLNDAQPPPDVLSHLRMVPETDGLIIQILSLESRASMVALRVLHADGTPRKGRSPFVDEQGDFVLVAPWDGQQSLLFLPHGATEGCESDDHVHINYLDTRGRVTGHSAFAGLPREGSSWSCAEHVRPFVHLAMLVAHADGRLDLAEVRAIQAFFAYDQANDARLLDIIHENPSSDIERLVWSLAARMPTLSPEEVLTLLVTVAEADGELDEGELEIIATVARTLDVPDRTWRRMVHEAQLALESARAEPMDARQLLGVPPAASVQDIETAYRSMMQQNHPERFAARGAKAIRASSIRAIQLREAYESLVSRFGLDTEEHPLN